MSHLKVFPSASGDCSEMSEVEQAEPSRVQSSVPPPLIDTDVTGPDGETFREIYDANIVWVWHALRRYSVPEKDVMDAAQNVFLVVHKKLPEFEGRSLVRTWIQQIVRRVASDYRRSAPVRREVVATTSELDERSEKKSTAEDRAAHGQRVEMARAILERLPESQRTVFVMYELEQMSGQEIALELGVPLGTVRSRLRIARDVFQREVQLLLGQSKLEVG